MFGLFSLIYSVIFFLNGIVILSDARFLSRVKLPLAHDKRVYLSPGRQKVVDMINTARTVFEIPLIVVNILCIVYEMFLG